MEKETIDLTKILPKKSYVNENLIIEKKGNLVEVYYINKYQNGKPKSKRFQPARVRVPKEVRLTKEFEFPLYNIKKTPKSIREGKHNYF